MEIDFSLFAKPIEVQLKDAGYKFRNERDIKKYNKILKGWNMLRVHSIATESEVDRMATRIVKQLSKDVVKEGK